MKTKGRKRCKSKGCGKLIDQSKIGLLQFNLLEAEEILCCTDCAYQWMEERRKVRMISSSVEVRV